jgi:nucleoside-diphosphate-sugar epimerase
VALRYFNVFGPRQDPRSTYSAFIPKFIVGIMQGDPLVLDGDGTQSRDFTFVSNVVQANLRAVEAQGVSGEVFNVACGVALSLNEIIAHLRRAIGKEGRIEHGPARAGDVPQSLADITRARERLGYEPAISARAGLDRVVAWFRERAGEGG